MKNVVWIASYPKSGNTWMRAFFSCLLHPGREYFINELIGSSASSRQLIEDELYVETSELTINELAELKPVAYKSYAQSIGSGPLFMKVHEAYAHTISNGPVFPAEVSLGAIYIVRNPWDVAVSFMHHNNLSDVGVMIKEMANEKFGLYEHHKTAHKQLPQKLTSWSKHVRSWTEQKDMPLLLVRYEDMLADSFTVFKKVVAFCGLKHSDAEISRAIEQTSFQKLQQQEQNIGFKERKSEKSSFFRNGKAGDWKGVLTQQQAQDILTDHYDVIKTLGYIV